MDAPSEAEFQAALDNVSEQHHTGRLLALLIASGTTQTDPNCLQAAYEVLDAEFRETMLDISNEKYAPESRQNVLEEMFDVVSAMHMLVVRLKA